MQLLMYYTSDQQKTDIATGSVMGTTSTIPEPFPVRVGLDTMNTREPEH